MLKRVSVPIACLLVLAGCKVDADITVTLREDGSGTIDTVVTLDSEVVSRVESGGRTLESAFPLDDLTDAGWEIAPWERREDGSARLRLTHDYSGDEELDRRIAEVVGPSRMVRNAEVIRKRGLLRSRDELAMDVDLRSPGTGIQEDPELVASLQGAGLDVASLDEQLQGALREALSVSVTVEAPGGRVETVEVVPGEEERVAAARSQFDTGRLTWFVIAAILAFLGSLLYLSASVGARRERARRTVREPERTPLM